jgi:hypothetical protein
LLLSISFFQKECTVIVLFIIIKQRQRVFTKCTIESGVLLLQLTSHLFAAKREEKKKEKTINQDSKRYFFFCVRTFTSDFLREKRIWRENM